MSSMDINKECQQCQQSIVVAEMVDIMDPVKFKATSALALDSGGTYVICPKCSYKNYLPPYLPPDITHH